MKRIKLSNALFLLSFVCVSISSCAFKDAEEQVANDEFIGVATINTPKIIDADRDGLSDDLERSIGRDYLTGEFPQFSIVDLQETTLTVTDYTNPDNKVVAKYQVDDSIGNNLNFEPIKEKIAKHAYSRTIGEHEKPSPIDIFDLGVLKISNFTYVQTQEIRNFILKNADHVDSQSVKIQSRFYIKSDNILGVVKINNIKAEVGYLSKNGAFSSFGNVFDLMTSSNTRLIFTSRGDAGSTKTNMDALIYLDRLPIDKLKYILDNDLQIAVKITDYTVQTVSGSEFRFSSQIQEAASSNSLFAVSTPEKSSLFFNARNEPIRDTLSRSYGAINSDSEGTLISAGKYETNTSYPITYEEGGREHLKSKAWYLFSENDKLTDVPNKGDVIMAGFYENQYVARQGERLLELQSASYEGYEVRHVIKDLTLGETLTIKLHSEDIVPNNSAIYGRSGESLVLREQCLQDDRIRTCQKYWHKGWCGYNWSDLSWYSIDTKVFDKELIDLKFKTEIYDRSINVSNIQFFKKNIPVRDEESGDWILEIKIDEEFIDTFGKNIDVIIPRKVTNNTINHGFHNYTDCEHRNLGEKFHFTDSSIKSMSISSDPRRKSSFIIERRFKN